MKLKIIIFGIISLFAAVFVSITPAQAQQQDSALLDALVKKGVLSNKEAQDIEAQDEKEYNSTAASKITLASSIKNITFYGDLRLRYELRDGTTNAGATGTGGALANHGDSEDDSRWRYRLRFGVKGNLYDNFFFGFRVSTNPTNDRSGNVTFGHSDAAGPFGKGQSLLTLDQVYLGWHPTGDITLTGGQMSNPLYTTNLVWDDNINPAGAAEQWDHVFDKDLEIFATASQFVYQAAAGNGFTNGLGNNTSFSNTFMYAEQAGFKYNFDKDTAFKAAATFYTYSGTVGNSPTGGTVAGLYSTSPLNLAAPGQNPSFYNGPFVGAAAAPTTNESGINNLAVLEVPMEFDFKAWNVPMRIFGDFAYNTQADERADQARDAINAFSASINPATGLGVNSTGVTNATTTTPVPSGGALTPAQVAANKAANAQMLNSPTFQGVLDSGKSLLDQTAYQVGIEAGQLKKKGDWDGKLYWQSTGYYALDPNLVSETFNGATNLEGIVTSVAHNWTDGITSTLTYAHANPVNGKMATPTIDQDLSLGDIRQYNLFQADLMVTF